MTTIERIQLRRRLEREERLDELDERTLTEVFKLAEETADGRPDTITTNYHRIARVVRMACRRGKNLEADRQWREVV